MKLEKEIVSVSIRPKNLRELRLKSRMTLREVSKLTGLSTAFINDIELKHRTCSEENFEKLRKVFESLDEAEF